MTPTEWALAAAVIAAGATVQTAIGFGSMVVAVPLAAYFLPVDRVAPLLLPVSLLQTVWIATRHRSGIVAPLLLRRVAPWMLVGMLPAAWFVGADVAALRPLLGAIILGLAARELLGVSAPPRSEWTANAAIVAAGFVHGLFATGGPPLVWALARASLDKHQFRATLAAVWVLLNTILVSVMVVDGRITAASALTSASLLPAAAAGIALGQQVHARVDEARFKRVVWAALAVAAAPLLVAG